MAELTTSTTTGEATSCCDTDTQAACCEPMSARPPAPSAPPRTSRPVAAECVRSARETLSNLDQVDFEVGSTAPARQLLRTAALERLARCGPLVARCCRRLPRLAWRKRRAPTNPDMRSSLSTPPAGQTADLRARPRHSSPPTL